MATTVTYKDETIATVNNETKKLKTAGTWLEDDLTLTDVSRSAPTGTKQISITQNGTTTEDVTNYASAEINVNVSTPSPTLQTKSVTPTETTQNIIADNGYDGLSAVQINAIDSSYVGSGITQRSSADLSANGATVTAPSGYYSADATKTVASGTEGTPTAAKGTVSNHAIAVTPSVTNSEGYISGGTHNGSAVTVSASELVSGSLSITSNDTYDVTNYERAVVNVSPNVASKTVTANGTYNASTDSLDGYSIVAVNVQTFKTGSVTFTTTYNTAGNRKIVDISAIGFTPKQFYFRVSDKSKINGSQYAVLKATFETFNDGTFVRTATRYSNASNSMSSAHNADSWTTQTNYYLYTDGTSIYYRSTSGYILNSGVTYDWIAIP